MKRALKALLGERVTGVWTRHRVLRDVRGTLAAFAATREAARAEDVIDCLWSPAMRDVRPWQHREELLELARALEQRRPRVVLEIGTAAGGTLFLAACLAAPDALIVSIDLPGGPFGGGYPEWKAPLYRAFAHPRQRLELLRGDSHASSVQAALRALLDGRRIDYLLIDGDHSYAGVRADFEACVPLLADGALVAFHDIVADRSARPTHFVSDYWHEIRDRYPCREFVRDPRQDKCGLGVIEFRHDRGP